MPLPWKKSKSKSGRISRFVSGLQQSPKRGGSLVVETGFPTSLIDLFVKNRDRLNKSSSKRKKNKAQTQTLPNHSHPTGRSVLSPPPLPQKLDPPSVTEDLTAASKIEESPLGAENRDDGDHRGGGGCVMTVVVIKVFMVAVLALSTKKLAAGITLSAFSLLFLERVFTLLNLCPDAQVRLGTLIGKLIGRKRIEKLEESSSSQRDKVSFEIIESVEETSTLDKAEEREVQTIRDVVFTKEKSKSAKLRSKIVKKILPKKLRSYKKNRKMKLEEKERAVEVVEEEELLTEVSSLYSEDIMESKVSEGDEIGSNPPLLESCEEIEEEEEEESKGDLTKAIVLMIVIALAGLLSGKVVAIGLTLSSCLILRLVCCKSQTSL
ncbi:PREDICTED: uncharacterized protein LOC106321610 [Brassica oleracea var. oleracea]|uniref:Ethylene-responsive nuclear protein n=1 Tax=Brassica oleracea var. oleracea TaxID=109376 RepID=A0A0D2ZVX1_BRAOL|nr:PREDICTED: uncharacterized protein LOC106321610 [Brassica oleracea var. oleracea]